MQSSQQQPLDYSKISEWSNSIVEQLENFRQQTTSIKAKGFAGKAIINMDKVLDQVERALNVHESKLTPEQQQQQTQPSYRGSSRQFRRSSQMQGANGG